MGVRTDERMWYTADRSRLVPADDPEATFQAPKEFSDEEAKRLGVKGAGAREVADDEDNAVQKRAMALPSDKRADVTREAYAKAADAVVAEVEAQPVRQAEKKSRG